MIQPSLGFKDDAIRLRSRNLKLSLEIAAENVRQFWMKFRNLKLIFEGGFIDLQPDPLVSFKKLNVLQMIIKLGESKNLIFVELLDFYHR
jgi:hypothetical protein